MAKLLAKEQQHQQQQHTVLNRIMSSKQQRKSKMKKGRKNSLIDLGERFIYSYIPSLSHSSFFYLRQSIIALADAP